MLIHVLCNIADSMSSSQWQTVFVNNLVNKQCCQVSCTCTCTCDLISGSSLCPHRQNSGGRTGNASACVMPVPTDCLEGTYCGPYGMSLNYWLDVKEEDDDNFYTCMGDWACANKTLNNYIDKWVTRSESDGCSCIRTEKKVYSPLLKNYKIFALTLGIVTRLLFLAGLYWNNNESKHHCFINLYFYYSYSVIPKGESF